MEKPKAEIGKLPRKINGLVIQLNKCIKIMEDAKDFAIDQEVFQKQIDEAKQTVKDWSNYVIGK